MKIPAAEAQQDVAQSGNANGEATGIAKASDELADEDLDAVAGGVTYVRPKIIW